MELGVFRYKAIDEESECGVTRVMENEEKDRLIIGRAQEVVVNGKSVKGTIKHRLLSLCFWC